MKLRSVLVRLMTGCVLATVMCASAYAGSTLYRETQSSSRPHEAQEMPKQKAVKIYILSSASAIPRPISYIIGGVITTPTPILVIGRGETVSR